MQDPRPAVTTPNPEELFLAVEASRIGVWTWEVDSGLVRWSPQVEALFGFEPGTFPGTFEAFGEAVHEGDRAEVHAIIANAIATRAPDFHTVHRVWRKGEVCWVEGRGAVGIDPHTQRLTMRGVCTDVTTQKRLEEQLRASEERYRVFTDLASDFVYEVDLESAIAMPKVVAGSWERTTGYTRETLAAKGGWLAIVLPEYLELMARVRHELEQGFPSVFEYRITDARGEVRWLRDRARPLCDPETGKLRRIIGGVQDITERRALEDQLVQSQKLEALARLAGGVAHDFNNLLLVIFGATSALAEGSKATRERRTQALADLRDASERAADLTRSLLAFGRHQETDERPVSIAAVIEGARSMVVQAVGASVRVDMEPTNAVEFVHVDPGKLQLVLLNLAVNARDASPNGAVVRVRAGTRVLEDASNRRPPELAAGTWGFVEVSDDGVGISAEVRRRLFEPFFTTKSAGRGTGLGLATSHGVVRQMGGAIGVESTPGRGSTFTVYLPLCAPISARESRGTAKREGTVGGTECVLLVDDEPSVRRIACDALRDHGYDVREAASAEDALALPPSELARTRLLVTDVRLNGLDGAHLAEVLAARNPNLRVVLMSGYVEDGARESATCGARCLFLPKPFTPVGLASRVREALDLRA